MEPTNWLEAARQSIESRFMHILRAKDHNLATYVTGRLANLLLARLPESTASALIGLLPEGDRNKLSQARGYFDTSIGYTDFIEKTIFSMGCPNEIHDEISRAIADTFLRTISEKIPMELKLRMAKDLPMELKARMNLSQTIETKAA